MAEPAAKPDRLFVPLAGEPYHWFDSGAKRWELRRERGQFTPRYVFPGRRVELRLGYNSVEDRLWGTVRHVQEAASLREFFLAVSFTQVIPVAASTEEAIETAAAILGISCTDPVRLIGFEVELDAKDMK